MIGSDVAVKALRKQFGGFEVLKAVSLEIKQGEFFSLLGPSGCGKTTLLRVIAGFEAADSGEVLIGGREVSGLPPNKRRCNTVFQSYALFPHLTIYENIAFPLRLKKLPEQQVAQAVDKHLELVQLTGHAYKKPSVLSGGQKQRVAIARALINDPAVLLLDEPLSALDAKLRQHMLLELDAIHDKVGITFIYVTHDQAEALSVSDRIAVMDKGHVLQVGRPQEIYENPKSDFVARFIGDTNIFKGKVTSRANFATVDIPQFGQVLADGNESEAALGTHIAFAVRPEKIEIGIKPPSNVTSDLNIVKGIVSEPIYSGFQTKYLVRTKGTCAQSVAALQDSSNEGLLITVFRQHEQWSEGNPDIRWKDEVYLSWSAKDSVVVESVPGAQNESLT